MATRSFLPEKLDLDSEAKDCWETPVAMVKPREKGPRRQVRGIVRWGQCGVKPSRTSAAGNGESSWENGASGRQVPRRRRGAGERRISGWGEGGLRDLRGRVCNHLSLDDEFRGARGDQPAHCEVWKNARTASESDGPARGGRDRAEGGERADPFCGRLCVGEPGDTGNGGGSGGDVDEYRAVAGVDAAGGGGHGGREAVADTAGCGKVDADGRGVVRTAAKWVRDSYRAVIAAKNMKWERWWDTLR